MTEDDKQVLLTYPNLKDSDGEVVLTNEHVVLQRLVVGPGEWEGIQGHPGNQVYIHIKGGTWSERRDVVQFSPLPFSEAGSVGWIDATDIDESHDVGNTGDTPTSLSWLESSSRFQTLQSSY
ncbi:MAG: hypothetical protein WD795_14990 [Woeseia sp.]